MDVSTWNDGPARRLIRALAMPSIAALLLSCLLPPAALAKDAAAEVPRPTIVLVHGSLAGPSSWNEVVAGLRKDG
jgi:hypothetical protein